MYLKLFQRITKKVVTKEHYIPIDKENLLAHQIKDLDYNLSESKDLIKLFEILEHYFHNEGFNSIKSLKLDYTEFDPDKTPEERESLKGKTDLKNFNNNFLSVIEKGNYKQINPKELDDAINNSDLLGIQLKINFNEFKEYKLFVRGNGKYEETIKHYFFWKKKKEIEFYDRVIVYIEYKDINYFNSKNIETTNLSFGPSSIILKIFKRVPKNDLETVFPNAIPKMSLKDKLLLWIPAIAGGIPLLSTKVIPSIIAIYSAYKLGEVFEGDKIKNSLIQGIIALAILGTYLLRQYKKFINKKIHFSKLLSDSLYFKNIANNSGVFPTLIDAAEEEELKETILAYSFLEKSNGGLTSNELDSKIENWFLSKFNKVVDFDVQDALDKLEKLGIGKKLPNENWIVVPLKEALEKVDNIWDNIFNYNR
jgi:hypothetical protein